MQLTLLDTWGIQFRTHREITLCDEVLIFSSTEARCYYDNENVPKKLISELMTEKNCSLKIGLHSTPPYPEQTNCTLNLSCTTPDNNVLRSLRLRFNDKVKISLFIEWFLSSTSANGRSHRKTCLRTGDMTINSTNYTCEAFGLNWVEVTRVEGFSIRHGNIRIIASIPFQDDPIKLSRTSQRILDTGVATDVVIIAENGAEIKAHKSFLFAWSTPLQAMFQSGMEESQTGRLDMSDISEPGVRAFLRYIYYEDLQGPQQDVGIAYEMFYAAHKYEVSELEKIMLQLLLEGTDEDFGTAMAFEIYCFVRNIEPAVHLRSKMIGILAKKIDEVKTLPEYKELFEKNPAGAMELCEQLVKAAMK